MRRGFLTSCRYNVFDCFVAGYQALDAGDAALGHKLLERACQQGYPDACVAVAVEYVRGALAEPVPNRGHALLRHQCRFAGYSYTIEFCAQYREHGDVTWDSPLELARAKQRAGRIEPSAKTQNPPP
ncbi:MAG: hypothetical protein WKG01_31970 [Kofleriaceae bacterium]